MSASTSPLPYTGNKSCIVNTILSVMPKHTVYIEPCMGSAEVFFRKAKAEREILNAYGRMRDAIILHRDYKNVISYAACPGSFILLDPPYKGTEGMYSKANFDSNQHAVLFDFMGESNEKFQGEAKFLITYNNDPYIRHLAEQHGFDTFVQTRLHNMRQGKDAGALYEELLIANYDLEKQAAANQLYLYEQSSQLTLFDFKCDYMEEE